MVEDRIAVAEFGNRPRELYDPIRYMMSMGGKRLRPVLVLMACELFGGNPEDALHAALAVELFHNFTLVHDDIMDNAPLRRNKETVFRKWNLPVAILSGDLMMIKAVDLLNTVKGSNLNAVIAAFNAAATHVCEGQQLDMNYEFREHVTHDEYIEMITLKTAELLAGALKIGAIIGGAGEEDADRLAAFGRNIGIAFQVQDDLLDSFGEPGNVGKEIGGDIASNKKTLLLIELMQAAHKDDKTLVAELFAEEDRDKKIAGMLKLYHKYQVKEFAGSEKEKFLAAAFRHLDSVNVPAERKSNLRQTAEELMVRER
jgi:geranylgeranyl diphosphate synthase type II